MNLRATCFGQYVTPGGRPCVVSGDPRTPASPSATICALRVRNRTDSRKDLAYNQSRAGLPVRHNLKVSPASARPRAGAISFGIAASKIFCSGHVQLFLRLRRVMLTRAPCRTKRAHLRPHRLIDARAIAKRARQQQDPAARVVDGSLIAAD